MTNRMTSPPDARKVIVGVDTHKHVHVAVAIDTWGIRLGDQSFVADSGGYQALITWAETHGGSRRSASKAPAAMAPAWRVRCVERGIVSWKSIGATGVRVAPPASPTPSTRRWPPGPCWLASRRQSPRPQTAPSR